MVQNVKAGQQIVVAEGKGLVAHGAPMPDAIAGAKDFLVGALRVSDALHVGGGHGPVHHFWRLWRN